MTSEGTSAEVTSAAARAAFVQWCAHDFAPQPDDYRPFFAGYRAGAAELAAARARAEKALEPAERVKVEADEYSRTDPYWRTYGARGERNEAVANFQMGWASARTAVLRALSAGGGDTPDA